MAPEAKLFRRHMELPRHLCAVEGMDELQVALRSICAEIGAEKMSLLTGSSVSREIGARLAERLSPALATTSLPVADNRQATVSTLCRADGIKSADVVVAVGGGTPIDVAKSVCRKADLPVIVVPTMLSTDGIASPVSVLADEAGQIDSHPARLPMAVVADLDVIATAPVESARAGLGDLVANHSAVADWNLAAEADRDVVDDFAALLSYAASELVWGSDVSSLRTQTIDPDLLIRLLQGLVLSGLAMEIAGSSRPCSGAEHLISHALDRLYPGTAAHGEQVAFGTIITAYLRGEDWRKLRHTLETAGMESAANGFGLLTEQIVEAIRLAPSTRPGRYTVLDEVDLSVGALTQSVSDVLSHSLDRC